MVGGGCVALEVLLLAVLLPAFALAVVANLTQRWWRAPTQEERALRRQVRRAAPVDSPPHVLFWPRFYSGQTMSLLTFFGADFAWEARGMASVRPRLTRIRARFGPARPGLVSAQSAATLVHN